MRGMGSQYRDPPLLEALCELRFDPKGPWDQAMPGLIYEALDDGFPIRREAADARVVLSSPRRSSGGGLSRMRFFEKEESSAVQISPHFLAVNQLRPYPSWEVFLPKIERALAAYRKVVDPVGLTKIELKYLNEIALPTEEFDFADLFNLFPYMSPGLPSEIAAFIAGGQFLRDQERGLLKVTLQSTTHRDEPTAILSLTYRSQEPQQIELDEAVAWLHRAHDEVEAAFEESLSEELKASFGRSE